MSAIEFDPRVGLCAGCRHAQRLESGKGSVFWLCRRAESDPRFRKYPPLPVWSCPGYEPKPTIEKKDSR